MLTSKLLLRPVREQDLEALFLQQADPLANDLAHFPARNHADFMRHWHDNILGNDSVYAQVIEWHGQIAGSMQSWHQDGMQMLGYWLGYEFWGQGIASAALHDFLPLLAMRPLYAYVHQDNLPSQRVLEKNGFTLCLTPQEIAPFERLFILD